MREQRSRATNSKHCLERSGMQARIVCLPGFPAARVPLGLFIEMPPLPVADHRTDEDYFIQQWVELCGGPLQQGKVGSGIESLSQQLDGKHSLAGSSATYGVAQS